MTLSGCARRLLGRPLGPVVSALVIAITEWLSALGCTIPDASCLALFATVFAALHGGLAPGLVSAALHIAHAVLHFSNPGTRFDYTADNAVRLAILAVAAPAIVLVVVHSTRRLVRGAAQDLAEAESLHQATLAASGDLLFVLTGEGSIRSASRASAVIARRDPDSLRRQSIFELFHPDDLEALRNQLSAATHGRRGEDLRLRLRNADGHWIQMDSRVSVIDHAGASDRLVMALTDVSARKTAEDQLRQTQVQQRTVLAALPLAVLIADAHGRIIESNAAARTLWGTVRWPESLDQLDQLKARHPDTGTALQHREFPLARALATGEPVLAQVLEIEAQTGLRRTVLCSAVPMRDGSDVTGAVLVQVDLTEKRQLEDQLRRAQRTDAMRGLANGVAHDLNNQLTVISGYTGIMLVGLAPTDPMRASLETVLEAAHRAAALTRQLQAFSRKDPLAPRVLDLREVLTDLEPILRHLAGESIRLSIDGGPESCPVRGDVSELEQVLMNLAINTRDAMPAGSTSTIALRRTPSGEVVAEVADTAGNEQKNHPHPGLAAVRAIARQMGGRVEEVHTPGAAFALRVILPAAPADEGPPAAETGPNCETILLVEDEPGLRELATEILRTRGYHVLTARNGAEALLLSARHQGPIQLLLSDVFMPDLRGEELACRLIARRPELRVLLVSGQSQAVIFPPPGVPPVLAKPFTAATLERAVRATLEGRREARPAVAPQAVDSLAR
jgi:two-component system cell cycle sensor histidine kinase/response regulator CckA